MIEENMKDVLNQAQNIFCLNQGLYPTLFMRLKNNKNLVIEYFEMNTFAESIESCNNLKNKIESGDLEEFIFMFDEKVNDNWILIVIKSNIKKEIQYECDIWIDNGVYNFSDWRCYNNSNALGKKGYINNLFGQVFCKFN